MFEPDINFDRKGRCPVCRRPYQDCSHSYSYVQNVLKVARQESGKFRRDVENVKRRMKGK